MKKRAFVESLKEMGTAPFGLENDKTKRVMDFFAEQDSKIEESNGRARKFGASGWNEKLAGMEKQALLGSLYRDSSHGRMRDAVRYDSMLAPHIKERDLMSRSEKVWDSAKNVYRKAKRGLVGDLDQKKLGLVNKARFAPTKKENKIQGVLGLAKKSSKNALVFNVKKERTETEPKKTIFMDHSNYLATKEKLANLKRNLYESQ